jgi:hypothetical protein
MTDTTVQIILLLLYTINTQRMEEVMVLNDDGRVIYQKGQQQIRITKNSVSFNDNVYQLCNITGFSSGKIKRYPIVPFCWIFTALIVGFTFIAIDIKFGYISFFGIHILLSVRLFGIFVFGLAATGIFINIGQDVRYGLILTLNSGDKHLFITTDNIKMKEVISQLYEFIDSKMDGVYLVNVTDNSIHIKGSMTGVAASGAAGSTITSDIK